MHGNWNESSRKLEILCTDFGRGEAHGFYGGKGSGRAWLSRTAAQLPAPPPVAYFLATFSRSGSQVVCSSLTNVMTCAGVIARV